MFNKVKEFLAGRKVHVLMAVGAVVAVAQFLAGINLGVPELPPATGLGELVSQLWAFAVGSGFRAAVAKK